MTTRVIVCLDGCGPDYLAAAATPNLDALAAEGYHVIGEAVVPTVTNVNNTSIVTASFPATHGITTNYLLDPATGQECYLESADYLLAETAFRRVADGGGRTALFTAKDKLKSLIGDGAAVAESAEKPSAQLAERIGPPPGIYTVEVNHWLLKAALDTLRRDPPDFLYCSTTDYVTHTYPPEAEIAQANVREIDRLIGELVNAAAEMELVVTADHGMNAKSWGLDLEAILKARGIAAQVIPIIKDRHVVHHRNLGGAAYVYLADPATEAEAAAVLREERGVESVLDRAAAARDYRLHPGRIGHLFVLADRATVVGSLAAPRQELTVRSHGSLHERQIPIYAHGAGPLALRPRSNAEVAAWIFGRTAEA
ncbi:MAG: alkaline phosphatase family protein [Syntrophales bacterium]